MNLRDKVKSNMQELLILRDKIKSNIHVFLFSTHLDVEHGVIEATKKPLYQHRHV